MDCEDNRVPLDAIKLLAHKLKDKMMKDGEILDEVGDITPLFFRGIRQKLIKGENLNILCKGQTTKGKSTAAAFIKYKVNQIIKYELKQETSYKGEDDEFELICADQIEFLRLAKRDDLHNVCCQIDEFSPMGNVGINSSVENSELDWYSKVCAQKFLHKVYCTPEHEFDRLTTIHLEVIDVDKPKSLSKLKVYYNEPGNYESPTCLGVITLDVGEILEKEWYKLYVKRKHFAMDLLLKHALKGVRDIEGALTKVITFKRLYDLASIKEIDRTLIINELKKVNKEMKTVYSIVGENFVAGEAQAMLQLVASRKKKYEELNKNRKIPLTDIQTAEILKAIDTYNKAIIGEYKEAIRLINLYRDYMSIGNKYFKDWIEAKCKNYKIDLELTVTQECEEEDYSKFERDFSLQNTTEIRNEPLLNSTRRIEEIG